MTMRRREEGQQRPVAAFKHYSTGGPPWTMIMIMKPVLSPSARSLAQEARMAASDTTSTEYDRNDGPEGTTNQASTSQPASHRGVTSQAVRQAGPYLGGASLTLKREQGQIVGVIAQGEEQRPEEAAPHQAGKQASKQARSSSSPIAPPLPACCPSPLPVRVWEHEGEQVVDGGAVGGRVQVPAQRSHHRELQPAQHLQHQHDEEKISRAAVCLSACLSGP